MSELGAVSYDAKKRQWRIECAPHVSLRLKRVFAKLSSQSHGIHRISDTVENARELEWFLTRFPMAVDAPEYLAHRAIAQRDRESLVEALLSRKVEARAFDLAIPAREYQRIAATIALESGGLLLADDVGLGKTASAICMLADPRTLPAIVVTLTALPKQWEQEINRFAPKLRTHIVKKGTPYDLTETGRQRRHQLALPGALPDVIIINYHKLAGWAETLAALARFVVFDECQELRRSESDKWAAAHHIAKCAEFRLGLSATPIFNYGGEFFPVLSCIRPDALGTSEEFMREWCTGAEEKGKIKDPKAFGTYVRSAGLMLRRTRADVGRELPKIQKVVHHVDSDEGALARISKECAELARIILAQGESTRGAKMMASEEFSNKLRQATGIAKAPYVAQFVRLLVESGEKVVVFAWHREVYSILLDGLKGIRTEMFTGSESPTQKEAAKKAFIEGDAMVLLVSSRSGAGIDGLQRVCRTAVHAELDWSPGVMEQCDGRIYRDGQPEPVVSYRLVSEHGADPIMADVLGLKRAQIEGLRDPDQELVEALEVSGDHVKKLAEAYLAKRDSKGEEAA